MGPDPEQWERGQERTRSGGEGGTAKPDLEWWGERGESRDGPRVVGGETGQDPEWWGGG